VHVPESILAVAIMTIARKEESAVRKFREVLRMGATDYNGDEHNLAETYGRTYVRVGYESCNGPSVHCR
jgi:hypothetical protein